MTARAVADAISLSYKGSYDDAALSVKQAAIDVMKTKGKFSKINVRQVSNKRKTERGKNGRDDIAISKTCVLI